MHGSSPPITYFQGNKTSPAKKAQDRNEGPIEMREAYTQRAAGVPKTSCG